MSQSELRPAGRVESVGEGLPAGFGLGTATFVVVASMVGVGVLTTSGFTVNAVGSNQLMLILWVIGGLAALCGALTLAELAAAMPRAGGEYVILLAAYGPLAGFLSGWVTLLLGFAAPIAASASGTASYLVAPLGLEGQTRWLAEQSVGSLAILAFAVIHSAGQHHTVRAQGLITLLKISLLVLFVVAGLAIGWPHAVNLNDRPPITAPIAKGMTFSLVYIAYAYCGWNAAAYLAGEVENPQRKLPWALLLGTGGVMVLYLALNVVYALALPAEEVRQIAEQYWIQRFAQEHIALPTAEVRQIALREGAPTIQPIAQLAAERLFGSWLSKPFSIAVGLMLLSSLSAYILAGPRVAYAMAQARQFPEFAGRLSPKTRTPTIATVILSAIALTMLWTGTFQKIVIYASVGMAVFSMLTVAAVYVLRWRRPDLPRPFRTPGYPLTPAFYLVVSIALTLAAFVKDEDSREVTILSLASIAAGVPVYYLWNWRRKPKSA
jgi:APA family basic amino acid/polyamine antiporter